MSAPKAKEGDGDASALGPHSCSSRPKQTNGDGGERGGMGRGGKTESYTYAIPFLPVSPQAPPEARCSPSPLQYCFFLLFTIRPPPQSAPQPGMGLASPPLPPSPPQHPPTLSPRSSLRSG